MIQDRETLIERFGPWQAEEPSGPEPVPKALLTAGAVASVGLWVAMTLEGEPLTPWIQR